MSKSNIKYVDEGNKFPRYDPIIFKATYPYQLLVTEYPIDCYST